MSIDHHHIQVRQAAPPPPPLQPPDPMSLHGYSGPPSIRKPVRLPPILSSLALIIAVAALIVVITDSVRGGQDAAPPPAAAPTAPTYTAEQINAAKQQTCTAAERSIAGVRVATNRPGLTAPDDPLGWANTANARVALLTAAVYLPRQVDPATPQTVKEAVDHLTLSAGDAVSAALTDGKYAPVPDDAYSKAIDGFNLQSKEVQRLCQE